MIKKILITGANGLLGVNAAITLCRKGYDIRLMMRRSASCDLLSGIPAEIVTGNIDNYADVEMAVKNCDAVVHAASATEQWGLPLELYENINIKGTTNVINACIYAGVKKLIYISTANTIAPGSMEAPGNELGSFNLFYLGMPYINTKYIGQQQALEAAANKRLKVVVINPTFMLGPYDSKPSSGKIIQFALGKRVLFYPPGGKNFVHVRDVCACIIAAIDSNISGECFLAAGSNLSYKEFFQKLNMLTGQRQWMIKIPPMCLKMAGIVGSFLGVIVGKRLKLNYGSARLLCLHTYYSNAKSKTAFNIAYQPVETALEDAIDWFTKK